MTRPNPVIHSVPDHQPSDSLEQETLSKDDREFLELLKQHHIRRRYQYMRQWWQKKE